MTKMLATIKPAYYYGWEGYCLSNQDIEIGITPSIGGRIISLKYKGKELLFVDHSHAGETFNLATITDLKTAKQKMGFRLWGGDKTWVAPEANWIEGIPPLDLDASAYETKLAKNSLTMTSPIDRETGLQIIRTIALEQQGNIILTQTFSNKSDKPVTCGIWDVTQHLRPSEILIPIAAEQIQPDSRFKAAIEHRREIITTANGLSKIICKQPWQFKYGSKVNEGYVILQTQFDAKQTLSMQRTFNIQSDAIYPHDNHMVEVYNSDVYPYFELEILGPLTTLAPGQTMSQQQNWLFSLA